MIKLLIYIVLGTILWSGCQQQSPEIEKKNELLSKSNIHPVSEKVVVESKTPMLDSIRNEVAKVYTAKNPNALDKPLAIRENKPCKPCDIKFLSSIVNKKEYTAQEMQNLFCINNKECEQNVEFSEFYNETLFYAIENNPSVFFRMMDNPKINQNKELLLKELSNPVHDGIKANEILIKAMRSATSQGVKFKSMGDIRMVMEKLSERK